MAVKVSPHQSSISGQNLLVNNPTTAETVRMREQQSATAPTWQKQSGQPQPADTHMEDRRRGRKRADKEMVKGDLETLHSKIRQLESEREFLRQDKVSLGEKLDKLKKKNKEQHERIQQLSDKLEKEEAEHKNTMAKYIGLLEKSNQFMNPRFPGQQHGLSASIHSSVAGNPAIAI